jgi:hypothetical protein
MTTTRNTKVALAILAAVVVGLTVALVAVGSSATADNGTNAKRISSLERQLRAQQVEAKKPNGEPALVAKLSKRVKLLEDCLPELQSEINGLGVTSDGYGIENNTNLSRVCEPVMYPNNGRGE